MRLGEMLIEAGLADEEQIASATARHPHLRVGSALIVERVVDADVVNRSLAQQQGLAAIRLVDVEHPDPAARALIPDALARRLHAVGLSVTGTGKSKTLMVAMRDPGDLAAVDELTFAVGMKVDVRIAPDVYLREALERAGVEKSGPVDAPAAAAGGDGGLELEVDAKTLSRRGRAPTTRPPLDTSGNSSGKSAAAVLPPLQVDPPADPYRSTVGGVLAPVLKLGFVILGVVVAVYLYKRCMVSNTKAVGTHYNSKILGVGIDFPDSGWRVAPSVAKSAVPNARAEYFYRGNAPEFPVSGIMIVRGDKAEVSEAAEILLGEVVRDLRAGGCKESYARPGGYMCTGAGRIGLFGKSTDVVEVEVHAWTQGNDTMTATWIKPDHTLSETEYVLGSITDL